MIHKIDAWIFASGFHAILCFGVIMLASFILGALFIVFTNEPSSKWCNWSK